MIQSLLKGIPLNTVSLGIKFVCLFWRQSLNSVTQAGVQSAMARSWFTVASTFQAQVIFLPQLPQYLGLRMHTIMPG